MALESDCCFCYRRFSLTKICNTIINDRANDTLWQSWINLIVPGAMQVAEFRANFEIDDVSAIRSC